MFFEQIQVMRKVQYRARIFGRLNAVVEAHRQTRDELRWGLDDVAVLWMKR
jgi:hypothetical protein